MSIRNNKYDAVIIGGGLGGLISGAKLAKEGKKVFLIEQHYVPGGCATTFKRKDYTVEVGLHEMDGLDPTDPKTEIFDDLDIFNNIDIIKLPEFYRFKNERVDIVIPDDTDKAIDVLVDRFPNDKKGIKKFFKIIHAIQTEINKLPQQRWMQILLLPIFPILYPYLVNSSSAFTHFTSLLNPLFLILHPNLIFWKYRDLGTFLDGIINDEDLKLVLQANLQYYHDDPYSMSLVYFSAAQASYYKGGNYIKGGSQQLSNYLVKIIKDNGGEVLLSHKVKDILMVDEKAIGASYHSSLGKDIKTKSIFADIVIANTAIPNVVEMLPEEHKLSLKQKSEKLETSNSLITIYIGFKKEVKELSNKHYSTFIFDESVKNQNDMLVNHKGSFEKRNFVFVDYSQIDSGLAPRGKSVGAVCTVDYLTDWETLDKESYKKKKEEVAQIFFKRLEKLIPGISNEIDYYEVGTSKTIERYTLNPRGSVYGFAQVPEQAGMYRLPNKSPIQNLYFASAWTNPGGGFTGAILSGWFCANEILRNHSNINKKFNPILQNPYVLLLISGLLLNISFFIQNIYAGILALFTIAPAFYALTKLTGIKRYYGGLIFFGVWFIPTVYWWFLIFEWWDALSKLSFFTLLALSFYIPTFIKKKNIIFDFALIVFIWTAFTVTRLTLPFTQSWWMAHIGYTQWLNPLFVQTVGVFGVAGLIVVVLLSNATVAYLFIKGKIKLLIALMLFIITICLVGNYSLQKEVSQNPNAILLAVQTSPSGGVLSSANEEDIKSLKLMTLSRLETIKSDTQVIVIWPENMITASNDNTLQDFAKENDIYLAYNRAEPNGDNHPFNTVVMIDNFGQVVMTNYKRHKAPGEEISEKNQFESTIVSGINVTADICYDLHFTDIGQRIIGQNLLIAPVDDDRFGNYMPYMHAADITFRAIENNVSIVTASTNGPTFFVNESGVVIKKPLKVGSDAVLVVPFEL